MTSLGLRTSMTNLDYAVGSLGLMSLALGLVGLINPLVFLSNFNLKPTTSEARQVAKDLLVVYADRDLALGFAITAAAYYGHREIMGWSMVGVCFIALFDGVVSRRNERGGEWKHWACIGLVMGLAGGCFGLF